MKKEITINNAPTFYVAPDDGKRYPGLIVIEEVWGVTDHIKSVAERFSNEGFVVVSPELLPAELLEQITPEMKKDLFDPEKRNALQPKLREMMGPIMSPEFAAKTIETLRKCVDFLLADGNVNGTIFVLGFCFGGTYSFQLAAKDNRVKAAVPFYGQAPVENEIKSISCPVLAFYGDQDANLMAQLPKLKEQMAADKKDFTDVVYPNAGHAFFNDTNERMYNKKAADDAWKKTLEFLKQNQ